MADQVTDQRKGGIRRDINGLVRGKDGEISGSKIGTYIAQYISAKLLLTAAVLPTWDVLAVLFFVLIAPEAYKKLMIMKWGGSMQGAHTERTTRSESASVVATTKPT